MKTTAFFFTFLFAISCGKLPMNQSLVDPTVDIVGVWETESIQHPGWQYHFDSTGVFCQRPIDDSVLIDCGFTWSQSNDTVIINGSFTRLWTIFVESDTSIVIWSFDLHGNPNNNMRLIRE